MTEAISAGVSSEPPQFRKPRPADAIEMATWVFRTGERVDLQSLADRLDVGRTTLYRWVGDREQLLDQVMATIARDVWLDAAQDAKGNGLEHTLDAARLFMNWTASDPALIRFADREPALMLRVLMNPQGRIARNMALSLRAQLEADLPEVAGKIGPGVFDLLASAATALEWANVVAGHEAQIDTAVDVMRTVLNAHIRT